MKNTVQNKLLINSTKFILLMLLNVIFYVLVVLAISKACTSGYHFFYTIFGNVVAQEAPGTDVAIEIKKGESTMDLASTLAYNGVVTDKYTFYIRAKLSSGEGKPIMPGRYELNTCMTYQEILDIITDYNADQRENLET